MTATGLQIAGRGVTQAKIAALHAEGLSVAEIAEAVPCGKSNVSMHLSRMGLKGRYVRLNRHGPTEQKAGPMTKLEKMHAEAKAAAKNATPKTIRQKSPLTQMYYSAMESMTRAQCQGWYGYREGFRVEEINRAGLLRKQAALDKHGPYVREAFGDQVFRSRDYARKKKISSSKGQDELRWMVQEGILKVVGKTRDNANLYQVVS